MTFVDVTNDIAFRKIFGNESKKIILISFLNAILKLQGNDRIVEVEILNPYQLPIIRNLKATIIDVRARDQARRTFIIEMQVADLDGMDKRLLYYSSKEYAAQIAVGDQYHQLRPVIFIGIFDFPFTQGDQYLSHHSICNVETGERIIKDMDFFFIELPKFNKSSAELTSIAEKWIFFIKEAENLNVIPENANDEGLVQAYQDANRQSWNKEEWDEYIYAGMREQDARGRESLAVERAVKKAIESALQTEKEAVARRLLDFGLPIEQVAVASGLSLKDVEKLAGLA
jgi:predicted transposase/invertase (TIGR01784 family)